MNIIMPFGSFPVISSVTEVLYLPNKLSASNNCSDSKKSFQYGFLLLLIYVLILFLLHALRIGDYNYWGDEGFSIRLSRMNFADMLENTAGDVHPPLYYILLKIVCFAFGDNPFAYNLTSLIPYGIFLALSVTVIRKEFGCECSAILVTFAALLDNSITYNVEARMYSWGLLFIFLSYYALYKILLEQKMRNYVWYTVASLCAAYTHYYCLIVVAFFYLFLLVMCALNRKKYLKPVLLTCACTVAGYLPWLLILLQTLKRVSGGFWLDFYPSLPTLFVYLFSTRPPYQYIIPIIFLLAVGIYFIKELNIIPAIWSKKAKPRLQLDLSKLKISTEALWILVGLCSVFGTMVIGVLVSKLVRPVLILRYLYPAAVIAWVAMGVAFSKFKRKKAFSIALILLVLLFGIPNYINVVTAEKQNLDLLDETLMATSDEIVPGDYIQSTHSHIPWTISEYYYPGVSSGMLDLDAIEAAEDGTTFWLFIETSQLEATIQQLEERRLCYEEVVNNGILGTNFVSVYKIVS